MDLLTVGISGSVYISMLGSVGEVSCLVSEVGPSNCTGVRGSGRGVRMFEGSVAAAGSVTGSVTVVIGEK